MPTSGSYVPDYVRNELERSGLTYDQWLNKQYAESPQRVQAQEGASNVQGSYARRPDGIAERDVAYYERLGYSRDQAEREYHDARRNAGLPRDRELERRDQSYYARDTHAHAHFKREAQPQDSNSRDRVADRRRFDAETEIANYHREGDAMAGNLSPSDLAAFMREREEQRVQHGLGGENAATVNDRALPEYANHAIESFAKAKEHTVRVLGEKEHADGAIAMVKHRGDGTTTVLMKEKERPNEYTLVQIPTENAQQLKVGEQVHFEPRQHGQGHQVEREVQNYGHLQPALERDEERSR